MTDTVANTVAPVGRLAVVGRFLKARMAEASTYRGAMLLLTAAGVLIRPEVAEAITAFGLATAGLLGVFFPDTPQPVE
jgi:hypothetical protein